MTTAPTGGPSPAAAAAPAIEVIIPVHDAGRPLARALRSLRDGSLPSHAVAVTVVCHNIPVERITETLSVDDRAGVTFLSCDDGRPTPAGPRALALERSTARYASFVDSDDWLEPGALAAWLAIADRDSRPGDPVAAVIAPERHASRKPVRNPPLRVAGGRQLDPRRDRLPYRSALRGLYSVEAIRADGIRFGDAPGNGSDLAFSLGMWFAGRPLRFAERAPAYVLGDDANDRVTRTPRPLAAEMAACRLILESTWFARLPEADRRLVATKFVRVHLLPGLVDRVHADPGILSSAAADAAGFLALVATVAPDFERSLSLRDHRFVRILSAPRLDEAALRERVGLWQRFRPLSVLLTPRPGDLLRRDAPPRWVTAMLLLGLRMRPPAPHPPAG